VIRRAAIAGLLLAAAVPAAADAAPILLPSVRTPLSPGPPLVGSTTAVSESLVPLGTTSAEEIRVGVDATGKPVSVVVIQRLRLSKLGDYTFAVPGPIAGVEAAPGSDSEPGLRHDAIVWAGFSPGHKTLAARVNARVKPAASLLPLRVTLTRTSDALVLRGENVTGASGLVLVGPVQARSAAAALDATRRNLRVGAVAPDLFVDVPKSPGSKAEQISAPLEVRGDLAGKRFAYRLGDGDPLAFELRALDAPPGAKLHLTATPVAPERLLTPPGDAATWAEALRRRLVDPSTLLEKVSLARLTVARSLQYATYLANPDVRGRSKAVYVYRTAGKTAAVATAKPDEAADGTLRAILVAALAVLGTGGLVVLWANS
jgi:hypothetical protein